MKKSSKSEFGRFLGSRGFWEIVFPLCMAGLSAYLWTVADAFRGGSARYEMIGPSFFPKLILGISLLICAIIGGQAFWAGRFENTPAPLAKLRWGRLLAAATITFIYAVSLSHFGFLLATVAFQVMLLGIVFQLRRPSILILAPLLLTGILIVIFAIFMKVPLPRGIGAFSVFSRMFY